MTDKPIRLRGDISNDYFGFEYNRKSTKTLKDYIDMFNIDDYWIYKRTRHQKEVNINDFNNYKYSGYIFFKKIKYNKDIINKWLEYIIDFGGIQFLDKPLPPFDPEKIKIKK